MQTSVQANMAIMSRHKISYQVNASNGHLYALDQMTNKAGQERNTWIDVTGWSTRQMFRWLGY